MTAPGTTRRGRSLLVQDLRLAAVVAVFALVGFGVSLDDGFQVGLSGGAAHMLGSGLRPLLEVAVETAPLAFRRVAPLLVFVLTATASLATQELNHRPEPLPLAVLVALYTVQVTQQPLVSGLAGAGYVLALAVTSVIGLDGLSDDQFYTDLIVVAGTMTLGYGISLSRTRTRLAEQQAADVIRAAEARTRAAVEQEQARIAREMHDILAHHLSVIVAQAAAARRVSATRPEAAGETLRSVEAVGREALSGLRRVVGLLRVGREPPDRFAEPGLDRLDALVEQVRRAGRPVELSISGRRRPLPAAVEATAFRIVQEGLTNSLRHGGPARATVTVRYGDDVLDVEVRDERATDAPRPDAAAYPPAEGAPVDGFGLVGMRQRVALLGGELVAGPHGSRGFRVVARLPVAGGGG